MPMVDQDIQNLSPDEKSRLFVQLFQSNLDTAERLLDLIRAGEFPNADYQSREEAEAQLKTVLSALNEAMNPIAQEASHDPES